VFERIISVLVNEKVLSNVTTKFLFLLLVGQLLWCRSCDSQVRVRLELFGGGRQVSRLLLSVQLVGGAKAEIK
jgi:hypothetical protein